jgi:hypothetical protein
MARKLFLLLASFSIALQAAGVAEVTDQGPADAMPSAFLDLGSKKVRRRPVLA